MSAINFKGVVRQNEEVAPDIRRMTVACPEQAAGHAPHAGQFYMLRGWGAGETPLLSRPISVHDYDAEARLVTFLYQVRGEGTQKLAALAPGGALTLTGPCGNGFDAAAARGKRVAVVGGGIGVAPLLYLCKSLAAAGAVPSLFAGFRDEPYALEGFAAPCEHIFVATDSGRAGYHGLVTGILHPEQYDLVLTCGPMVMMRGVAALCAQKGVPCFASLERKMACGLGACLGCTCHTRVGAQTVCKDGPVFKAEEVFDL